MTHNPVLVLISGQNCVYCGQVRRDILPALSRSIAESKKVDFVDINLVKKDDPLPQHLPSDLGRFRGWYPIFIMFTGESWAEGKTLVPISVFNGSLDESGYGIKSQPTGKRPYSEVADWIKEVLSTYRGKPAQQQYQPQSQQYHVPIVVPDPTQSVPGVCHMFTGKAWT